VTGGRWAVVLIGGGAGVCFAIIGGVALRHLIVDLPTFPLASVVFAVIAVLLSYRSFQAAALGSGQEASLLRGLHGGLFGAFLGMLVVVAGFLMYGQTVRTFFAHPIGLHTSQLSLFRLLMTSIGLGFCAGFVLRIQRRRAHEVA
jgi:hypothetical protein